jgi:hypothetical protein
MNKTKERVTFVVDRGLMKTARVAVDTIDGATLSDLVEFGIQAGIKKLEKINKGPFKERRVKLKVGRPRKSEKRNIWGTIK